jgi:hypothetical protein
MAIYIDHCDSRTEGSAQAEAGQRHKSNVVLE